MVKSGSDSRASNLDGRTLAHSHSCYRRICFSSSPGARASWARSEISGRRKRRAAKTRILAGHPRRKCDHMSVHRPEVVTGEPASLGTRSDAPRQPPLGVFHTARFAWNSTASGLRAPTASVQDFGKVGSDAARSLGEAPRGHPSPQRPLGGAQRQRTQHSRASPALRPHRQRRVDRRRTHRAPPSCSPSRCTPWSLPPSKASLDPLDSSEGGSRNPGRFMLQKNTLNRRTRATREELRIAIATWIERTYYRRRRQDPRAD
jgi:hypothetical protein